jgi:hypothetical protein
METYHLRPVEGLMLPGVQMLQVGGLSPLKLQQADSLRPK